MTLVRLPWRTKEDVVIQLLEEAIQQAELSRWWNRHLTERAKEQAENGDADEGEEH